MIENGSVVNYYTFYQLDRTQSTNDIRKTLRNMQTDIKNKMSGGAGNRNEEINCKLQKMNDELLKAIKQFKNDKTRAKYDELLKNSPNAGNEVENKKIDQSLMQEIEDKLLQMKYEKVISLCSNALNEGTMDIKLYEYLAEAYFNLRDGAKTLETIKKGLNFQHDNLNLLSMKVRTFTCISGDFNQAQDIINEMFQIPGAKREATLEQIYLYITLNKDEVADITLEKYLMENPNDMEFRRKCAYDLVGAGNRCFEQIEADGARVSVLLSKERYKTYFNYCKKAKNIYEDQFVLGAYDDAAKMGKTEFNSDNIEYIKSAVGGLAVWILFTFLNYYTQNSKSALIFSIISIVDLAILIGLIIVSRRPYWQIYKYDLTGKREILENIFIILGVITAAIWKLIKACLNLSWSLAKMILGSALKGI